MCASRIVFSALAAAVVLVAAPPGTGVARADLLSGTVRISAGASGGEGLTGDLENESFAAGTRGATYGARVGVEVLFLNLWLGHDQYVDQDGLLGTWTTLPMIGFDTQLDVGQGGSPTKNAQGQLVPGSKRWFVSAAFGAGFGLGTGRQIDPPLDNSEVTDKGFMLEGEVGLNRKLGGGLSFGLWVPVQWRILFKNGADAVVNSPGDRYQELNVAALVGLRYKLKLL